MRGLKHTANQSGNMTLQELLAQLAAAHGWKAVSSLVGAFIVHELMPIAPFIAVGIGLVVCDFITGLTAAYFRKQSITSRRMSRTIMKIIFYTMAIVLVHVVETVFFTSDTTYLVYLVSAYISTVELYSNLENIGYITGTNILSFMRGIMESKLEKLKINPDANDKSNDKNTISQGEDNT